MFDELKKRVLEANLALVKYNLITLTWGNVSEIDRKNGVIAIKPSGVEYEKLTKDDIVVIDLNGNKIDGELNPSSDTPTHLELYRTFSSIGGIVHTHSHFATVFAQSEMGIPALGTTHADAFYGDIPCTRKMKKEEIFSDYELQTGKVIAQSFTDEKVEEIPGVLVCGHGPFSWGKDAYDAVKNAVILEEVARMAYHTLTLNKKVEFQKELLDKHYYRKHGKNAYYGQGK